MMGRPQKIIEGFKEHIQRCEKEKVNNSPVYMSKRDHDILANYLDGKDEIFYHIERTKDQDEIKSYLGVEIVIRDIEVEK